MIAQSTREEIVKQIKTTVDSLPEFSKVVRRLPSYEQLSEFAVTEFPVLAIVAGLPVPDEKESARIPAKLDLIVSDLNVALYCYLWDDDKETMDTTISTLLNVVWAAVYDDPTLGNRVLSTILKPEPESEIWPPFVAFKLVAKVKYVHTTGGI